MDTKKVLIIMIMVVCSALLFYQNTSAMLPLEDVTLPELHVTYLPIILNPTGNIATIMQDEDNQDNTVILDNLPDEPIIIDSVSDCGQWAEMGGHPCPQSDNVPDNIIPPANNNRNH
jgi:hypothetical protein